MANPFQIGIAVPFDEAIAAAKARGVVLPEVFYGHLPAAMRSRAFTVSGLAALDQVQSVMDSLSAATETGQTFRDWRKTVLADAPDLGKLPADRLDNIFRTAIQTHYNIGRWEQLESNKARRPYLMYDAINDGRTRPAHRAMDNHIAHIDDPWWGTHFPPNGFRCRCGAIALSEAQAKARGYGTKPTPDAQPDKGWDYHPAKGQDEALAAAAAKKQAVASSQVVAKAQQRARAAPRPVDPAASVPDCDLVTLVARNFAEGEACLLPLSGQKTWKDFDRPDLRRVKDELRLPSPALLERAASREAAVDVMAKALGVAADAPLRTVVTPKETVFVQHAWLPHMVGKEADARERYANFIVPTLEDPFEIWEVAYPDVLRNRYIGLFRGRRDFMVVVRVNSDGSLMWNVMQASSQKMNAHRLGDLKYWK
jgi:SPP1 gp7 family putative phage head morphogenesis protein